MRDNHKKCREELKLARDLCAKKNIPIKCYSEIVDPGIYDVFKNGQRKRVETCCACNARKILILEEYNEKKELVIATVGNDTFLTNKAGIKYIDDCAKNNRDIYWTKILKKYDEEIINRLKHEKLYREFYDAFEAHAKKME